MQHPPQDDRRVDAPKRLSRWKVWLTPLLVFTAAALLAAASYREFRANERASLDHEARRVTAALADRLRDYDFLLRGGLGLLLAGGEVTPAHWRDYVHSLDYKAFFPDALGLGYAPRVRAADARRFERKARALHPRYAIHPHPDARDLYPVLHFEPPAQAPQNVLGFDEGSEPVRREAMERAAATGAPALSGRVRLIRDTDAPTDRPSCLLIIPAYRAGVPTATPAQRRAALLGVIYVPFHVRSLVTELPGGMAAGVDMTVYDGANVATAPLLFASATSRAHGTKIRHTTSLNVYGRTWTIVFAQDRAGPLAAGAREPLGMLLLGAALALAVWRLVRNIDETRARAEALATAMTKELRASEAYNRAIFLHSSLPIAVCGADDRFLDVNTAMLDLLGYTTEEFLTLRWQEVLHPEAWEKHARMADEALAGSRESYRLELRLVTKADDDVWAQLDVGLVRGEDGAVRFFIGTLKDISERKAAEAARQEREAMFEAMFENNRAVCLLVDPETGVIEDANRAAAAYYGYKRDELRAMHVGRLNTLPPAEVARVLETTAREGGLFDFTHRLADGSLRRVRVHTGLFETAGRALLLSTVQDVTEQARAEAELAESRERFRDLVESMNQGVVLTDEAEVVTYVNPAFARLMNRPATDLVGRMAPELLPTEDGSESRRAGRRETYETLLARTDGATLRVRVLPFPLYNATGAFRGSCGLVADVTGEHAARVAETRRQARRAALLRLHEMQDAAPQELLDFALSQALALTGSPVGFICSYDETAREFTLHAWSSEVMGKCHVTAAERRTVYPLDEVGLWGDVVRKGGPVLVNEFATPNPAKHGWPEGHIQLSRFLCVPASRDGRVRAVVGVGDKNEAYVEDDITQLTLFIDGVWAILERERAERELRRVTERFRLAVRAGRVGLWEWNPESGEADCDAMMAEIFGLEDGATAGSPEDWLARVAPDERDAVRDALSAAVDKGERFTASFAVRRPDGSEAHIEASAEARLREDGRPGDVLGVFLDATPLRQAQRRLEQSHNFLQTLIDSLPHTVFCKDTEGRFLLVNRAFAEMRDGRPVEEYLGLLTEDVEPPEEARLHHEWDERTLAAGPGHTISYEIDRRLPDGGVEHRMVYKSLLALPEGGMGIVGINVDNTERKRAEMALQDQRRRLADIIEGTGSGSWEWDIAAGRLACNERWAELLGLPGRAPVTMSIDRFLKRVHPDDRPLREAALARHFSGEEEFFDLECRVRREDGQWLWTHTRGRVFKRGADGAPLLMSGAMTDIGARKLAEERLEMVARFPVENPNPVLRTNAGGEILYANPAAEVLLSSWTRQVGGPLPTELQREAEAALREGSPRTSERSYPSGVYSITISPFRDRGYVNIYAVDETQRKSAETALRISELRYRELAMMLRLLCDNVPDMIWAKDMDGGFLFANKAMAEHYLGLADGEDALGRTEEFFGGRVRAERPDDPEWHTIWMPCAESDQRTLETGAPMQFEEDGFSQGEYRQFEVSKAPFVNGEGVVIGTVGSARDITERKAAELALAKSEERFRTLAQVSPVGIFQADARGRCTYVNDQWARISGYPRSAALGSGWMRTLDPADRRTILRGLRATARTGDDFVAEMRFRAPKNGGQGRWALVRAAVERGDDGAFTGFAGAVTDINELKNAEAALRRAKAEAEAATQAKALFLANMSHEIRTPLAGVIGTTRLLGQSRLDEAQRRLADMAVDSGQALLEVVNDILDFSKIEAGRLTLRSEPFRPRRLLDSVTGPIAVLGRERNLNLSVVMGRNAPEVLIGDEARVAQVLRNLLTNALKFTETGGITVTVRTESRTAEAARLSFSVADTGCGIEPDYLPHLFESFSQGDSSYGKRHAGTGLGLAISKNLVEQMGGSLHVLSTLGKGSTFTVTIPFDLPRSPAPAISPQTPQTGQPAPKTPAAAGSGPTAVAGRGLRVLLADDNAIGRVLMEHVLRGAGCVVESVGDGEKALAALRARTFDAVLMDVQMPRLDGVSATRRLRRGEAGEAAKDIAVVALTAYTGGEDRRNFLEAGMDETVSKPAEEKTLFAAMDRALKAAAARSRAAASPAPAESAGTEGTEAPTDDDAPRLDEDYLARSFADNLPLLGLLLRQLRDKSLPDAVHALTRALESRDARKARMAAHKTRGALAAVGADRAVALAARTERLAANGPTAGDWEDAMRALLRELAALAEHLRKGLPWGPLKETT